MLRPSLRRSAFGLAALAAFALAVPSAEAGRLRDQVEADSFGNLVVWSRAGFKRSVVGRGDLAGDRSRYPDGPGDGGEDAPRVLPDDAPLSDDGYYDEGSYEDRAREPRCYRPPVFVKGRSYMYGLADGEMPQLSGCLDVRN